MQLSPVLLWTTLTSTFVLVTVSSVSALDTADGLLPAHCLQKRAIESNYRPTGFEWTFNHDLRVYQTRNESAGHKHGNGHTSDNGRLLFAVYDIFGFHPNTKQVVDKLAEEGHLTIAMPDFFRGGWPINDWPLMQGSYRQMQFQEFMARNGSWENVSHDLRRLVEYYKQPEHGGYKSFGIFGFCWGGKMSVQAATYLNDEIKAAAIIHPANVVTADANEVKTPMYVIPSADEPDMMPFYHILETKFGAEKVGHTRFKDMHHGFSAARANFNDPLNRQRVDEVIQILQKFFNQQLNGARGQNSAVGGSGLLLMMLVVALALHLV